MTASELAPTAPSRAHVLAQWTRALALLLFLSSAAAMIVALGSQPALMRWFSGDAELVILALGLGLGCLAGGLARPRLSPLPLFALLATINGAFGYLSLTADEASPALAVAPAFVSAMLMGVLVPVVLGHLIRRPGGVGQAFGDSLSVVMLGLAVACLASVAVLIPFFGERDALRVAVALDATIVVLALVARRRERHQPVLNDAPLLQRQPIIGLAESLWLAAGAGVLAISYFLFFAQVVAHAAAPSEVTFAATLAAFLLGLAAGAHRGGGYCALFSADEVMRRAARSAMAANLVGLATLPLLGQLAWLDHAVIIGAMLLCFVAARALGALLPYLAEFAIAADAHAKWRSALLCLAHATGATAGVWLTGRVLMEELSLVALGATLVIAGILYSLLLVALLDLPRWQKVVRGMTAVAVAILALAVLPRWSADVVERLQWRADGPPLINRDGRS
jgi:spermidine synthase